MPRPRLSRTVSDLLAKRGAAPGLTPQPEKAAPSTVRFDSAAESPSIRTIATDTTSPSLGNTREPSTSVRTTSEPSSKPAIRLPELTTQQFLFGPRPLSALELSSPGGQHLVAFANHLGGITPAEALEHVVGWAYSVGTGWGDKTLEDVLMFHKLNSGL